MKARGNHPVQVLFSQCFWKVRRFFSELEAMTTPKRYPKWIRGHWLARKPQRRWLEIDNFRLQSLSWSLKMLLVLLLQEKLGINWWWRN